MMENTKIALFKGKKIRKTLYQNGLWFVVEDIIPNLTDTPNSKDYIKKMRRRDEELAKGYGQIVHTLAITTEGGARKMNCANTEGVFHTFQSIPSTGFEKWKTHTSHIPFEKGAPHYFASPFGKGNPHFASPFGKGGLRGI